MYRESEGRVATRPQLVTRAAVMGGVAVVMFAVILFRLWSLQVLSGARYRAEATNNQVRNVTVAAPRGEIVDRGGTVLVDNRVAYAVVVDPARMPRTLAAQHRVWARLAPVLGVSAHSIAKTVKHGLRAEPFTDVTLRDDVPPPVYEYILENQTSFPSITVQQVFLRRYPYRNVGAQLFGTVGQISAPELAHRDYRGAQRNDRVGQSGIEASYDHYLRGADGAAQVQVDALGNLRGQLAVRPPRPGDELRLTINWAAEQAGQSALGGGAGAFVAMDVHDGEVLALGSAPTFDPNAYAKTITNAEYKQLNDPANGAPSVDRAIQGLYPTGSTFKIYTGLAALEEGVITPDTIINDPGYFTLGATTFKDNDGEAAGPINVVTALKVSSDAFFFNLGADLDTWGNGLGLQHWAHLLGAGHPTGIDLPAEYPGLIPSPAWRNKLFKAELKRDPNCEFDLIGCRPWSAGDNVNMAIGQGDVEVTPLQLATAYATLGNGGTVVRPHLGLDVEGQDGQVLKRLGARPVRHIHIDPVYRAAMMEGFHEAADSPGGTSYPVFGSYPIPIAGKTGTAQRAPGIDQSWYAALAPYPNPRYVVVVTFENGGYGVQTAAPAAERILSVLENVSLKKGQGSSTPPPSGVNLFG